MTAELKKTTDRQQRSRILGAMSSFRDPAIARAGMDMMIHSEIDARESLSLLFGPLGQRETEKLPFEFVKANYDELLKHLPTGGGFDAGAMLARMSAETACDEASRQEFVGFFQERAKKFTGGQHNYDQVLESIRLCEAQKSARAADIAAFFAEAVGWRSGARQTTLGDGLSHLTATAKIKLSHDSNAIRQCRAGTHLT